MYIVNGNFNVQRYIDQFLRPAVIPFLQQQPGGVFFQDDNARSHVTQVVQNFLTANNVNVLAWSARSPDLSLIEYLWDVIDLLVRQRPCPSANRHELIQALQDEWQRLPRDVSRRRMFSVRRRLYACIAGREGHTRCYC